RNNENLSLSGNLTWNVFESARLRVGGRFNTGEFQTLGSTLRVPFSPGMARIGERDDYQLYATWTQYLSNSTFYQVQVDLSDRQGETFDPRFGKGFDDFLLYGDIDEADFATLRGYKTLSFVTEDRDGHDVLVPVYTNRYIDGNNISSETTAGLVSLVGGRFNGYSKFHNRQFRFSASATTQISVHQIEFGAEYEQRTQRSWSIGASGLARYFADGNPEQIASDDPDLDPNGYSTYDAIPTHIIAGFVNNIGYDVRGKNEIDDENFAGFLDTDKFKADDLYNVAPYEPIYYGGYVQDKIEFRDIVLNLGLRVDVFDNNQRVLKDKFARRPIVRAGEVGSLPPGIGNDYAVYFSGDDVVGYRDLNGTFYDPQGQATNAGDILLTGKPRQTDAQITADQFEDYEPQVTVMPRIGVSFPVTDQALFFASYGVVSQRPSSNNFATIGALSGTGRINNNNLEPEKTTKYELGFRQRLGARSALTISGFFHQIENLIQLRDIREASPSGYSTYENVDFGTVKGLEFGFDLRRTSGFAANLNYTLSFADGTGSSSTTTSTIVWIDETPPNFISPLSFDQRHKMNLSLDYRLGSGEGPTIFGTKLLENFGINVLATAGSGFPYTGILDPFPVNASRAPLPRGGVNQDRMPWSSRVDLRVDRRFPLAGASLTAFLWVENLFDQTNTNNVWRFTGLPDDDGFLSSAEGAQFLASATPAAETLYHHRNRSLGNVGIPRMVRLGARIDF
ncbi:MAG: TonB-dependent receptor domain-containing protein, partial [Rhodothermales bacterium]